MKKGMIGTIIAVVVIIGLGFTVLNIDFNRLNKEEFFVQVTQDGVLESTKLDSGEVVKTYHYKLNAVSASGEEKNIEFTANKNLRKNAYLKLYVKKDSVTVSSYDEVKKEDLPKKTLAKFI